jgi:AraC family transcriptional activator of tynA and feaB
MVTVEERWSLDGVPPVDRQGQWQELLSSTHVPMWVQDVEPAPGGHYEARVQRQWIGELALVDTECDPCSGASLPAQVAKNHPEYLGVLITRSGSEMLAQGEAEVLMRPGDAVVWDSTQVFEFAVPERLVKRTLVLPRAALDEVSGRAWTSGGMRLDGGSPSVRLLLRYLDVLATALPELSASAASAARNATLELFVGAVRPGVRMDSAALGPALRLTMERWIDRHLTDQVVTPASIAAAHGVSVRTVHRVFRATGETLGEVIRGRRLARARDELAAGAGSITTIASRWGFSDGSHFCRAFKACYGTTPREYRMARALQQGPT